MARKVELTTVFEKEGDGFTVLCPELDIASQGETIDEARINIKEALELFFEFASSEEINARLPEEIFIEQVSMTV